MVIGRRDRGAVAVDTVLKKAGFIVSCECRARPSCFDFAARKDGKAVFVKTQPDIGSFSLKDSRELKGISEFFTASSILIGEKTREKPLEDDTVYSRYAIPTITSRTLENIVLQKTHPLIQANPGGYYVEIDGEAIKRRRQELGLSVGEAAKLIGISRRTIYGYERGMTKASVTAAYNMMSTLGVPVARPVDIFENSKRQHKCCFLTSARRIIAKNILLQKILKFAHYRITAVGRAPFDFVINVPEDNVCIIGGVAGNQEPQLNARVDEILSVSQVVQAHPILITEGRAPLDKSIMCIDSEAFSRIRNPEDLITSC
jgi:putative transcriptional regulator